MSVTSFSSLSFSAVPRDGGLPPSDQPGQRPGGKGVPSGAVWGENSLERTHQQGTLLGQAGVAGSGILAGLWQVGWGPDRGQARKGTRGASPCTCHQTLSLAGPTRKSKAKVALQAGGREHSQGQGPH